MCIAAAQELAGYAEERGMSENDILQFGAAITYLVERMIISGHLRRESDPADRRKVILRYAQHGIDVGRAFFGPLADHTHRALADLSDDDLAAAHRVFTAVLAAMGGFRTDLSAPPG